MIYGTVYFAGKAGINIGIITILWCIDPVYLAIADFFLNGQRLNYNHFIGIFIMLCCSVIISLSDYVYSS